MDACEGITTRRSVRRYTDKPVSAELIKKLLTAAMSGPSTGNQQPWQFVVITDRKQLDALASVKPYKATLTQAPLAVVVCGDQRLSKWRDFWLVDCSIATQNLLLAAHAFGLGAVGLGCHFMAERSQPVREILGLPDEILSFSVVPIGYPAQTVWPVERYQEQRVRYQRW